LAKKPLPKQPPRLNEVLRLIARLGGFLGRKGDGEPGVKTHGITHISRGPELSRGLATLSEMC
jgi:hypothetical protein